MENDKERITVGIADFTIGKSPQTLETYSLGSCVGVALYDPVAKIGGLVHIMLPESKQVSNHSNPAKFADTGISLILREMEKNNAKKERIVAKIVGGAAMFSAAVQDPALAIGVRNVEASKRHLKLLTIPIHAEDTGGQWGRTMIFNLETGKITVKSVAKGIKEI